MLDGFSYKPTALTLLSAALCLSACSEAPPEFHLHTPPVYIKADHPGVKDELGRHIAISADGTVLAVAAPGEDSSATGIGGDETDDAATDSGAVYVFSRTGTSWTQQAYIKASNTAAMDSFGSALALSADGTTLAVGAVGEDSSATGIGRDGTNDAATDSGAVYVFTRMGTTWTQQAYIKASNTGAGDDFGVSLALSADGSTLAVGADLEDSSATGIGGDGTNDATSGSGAVYVFTRMGTTWTQQVYIKASNTGAGDFFGYPLALSADGSVLVVGANSESSGATGVNGSQAQDRTHWDGAGAVYIFARADTAWTQRAYIKASNTGQYDRFAISLALSADGTTLAVGADFESSSTTGVNGDQSNDDAAGSGAVYVFTGVDSNWTQQAYIKASNTAMYDHFGHDISLSDGGSLLAVGAFFESSNATGVNGDEHQDPDHWSNTGAVYAFRRAGATWTQQAYIKAPNTGTDDLFGHGVALSGDGSTLAVGAQDEDSGAVGVGGDEANDAVMDSGAVYVY